MFWRAFFTLQHGALVSYGSKLQSSHGHGMFLSSGLAVLCFAQMGDPWPVPHFILLGMHFEEGSIFQNFPEAAQDVVFLDVIFAVSFTDENQNTVFVTLDCSSVLSNYSLGF